MLLLGCPAESVDSPQSPTPSDVVAETSASDSSVLATSSEITGEWILGSAASLPVQPEPPETTARAMPDSARLTVLVLQDLEFILLTWKSPGPHAREMEDWLATTKTRLENLKIIAAKARLDQNVTNAIEVVDDLLGEYRALCRTLRIINFVVEGDRTEGNPSVVTISAQVIGAGVMLVDTGIELGKPAGPQGAAVGAATLASIGAVGELLGHYGKKLDRASKYAALEENKATFVTQEINQSKRYFTERVANLKRYVETIDPDVDTRLASFELHGDIDRYHRSDPTSPFPHVMRAYTLVSGNRKAAAGEFAKAASKLPASSEIYSYNYRGPYLLLAGHLMEFDARHGAPAFNAQSARASVSYYQSALRELKTIDNVPYPYLISYARALALSGKADQARQVADRVYPRIPADPKVRAARTYDLACVYALSRSTTTAFQRLAESYGMFPRRDPSAIQDPLLRGLALSPAGRQRLENIVDHPLVGGMWRSADNKVSIYQFYPDGSLWQRRTLAENLTGFWSASDSRTLRLHDRSNNVQDVTVSYEIRSNQLTILHDGRRFRFTRTDRDLLAGYQNTSESGRRLSSNGTWGWGSGSSVIGGRYSTSRTLAQPERKFWYSWEDPLIGRLSELRVERKTP